MTLLQFRFRDSVTKTVRPYNGWRRGDLDVNGRLEVGDLLLLKLFLLPH